MQLFHSTIILIRFYLLRKYELINLKGQISDLFVFTASFSGAIDVK